MQPQENQKSPAPTKMVAPPHGGQKLVEIEVLRDCEIGDYNKDGSPVLDASGRQTKAVKIQGSKHMVSDAEARELLSFKVRGCYGFSGEREGTSPLQTLKKVRLVRDRKPKNDLESLDDEV